MTVHVDQIHFASRLFFGTVHDFISDVGGVIGNSDPLCPFGGPAQLRKMRTQMKNLPNQSRSVVMVGQNNRRPENEKVIDPEWPKGKKFRKPIPPKSRS